MLIIIVVICIGVVLSHISYPNKVFEFDLEYFDLVTHIT